MQHEVDKYSKRAGEVCPFSLDFQRSEIMAILDGGSEGLSLRRAKCPLKDGCELDTYKYEEMHMPAKENCVSWKLHVNVVLDPERREVKEG